MSTNTTKPTEIERAVITLLIGADAHHPALWSWIQAMATDINECRHLGNYTADESVTIEYDGRTMPLAECCRLLGYVTPTKQWDRDNDIASAIQEKAPKGIKPDSKIERNLARRDKYIFELAFQLARYRDEGRPDGDQSHDIYGMGGPLVRITTSLAAAVVEYHKAMINVIYLENDLY